MTKDQTLNLSDQLYLRPLELKDGPDFFSVVDAEREELGRYLPFVSKINTPEQTHDFLKSLLEKPNREYRFLIIYEEKLVGGLGTRETDWESQASEIYYWLSKHYRGKGLVTRSLQLFISYLFEQGLNRLMIRAEPSNLNSLKLAEKLSFTYEGLQREVIKSPIGFADLKMYSLLAREWNN
ncbi:MAG: GNAT family N-acetyltransferase [Candidatus Cyclobacteriaceae bacterium M3_2C_046]